MSSPSTMEIAAAAIGTSEAALRLLVVILLGVPLSGIYSLCFAHHSPTLKHIFFLVSGLWLSYFGFGLGCFHLVATIVASYVMIWGCALLSLHTVGTALVFLFTMAYLLWGYSQNATESYDVDWTTPHCVVTLRLIGLAFDVMDGAPKKAKPAKSDTKSDAAASSAPAAAAAAKPSRDALAALPGLLEVLAFSFCYCGATVGPQYSYRLYSSFVDGTLVRSSRGKLVAGFSRLLLGLLYVGFVAVAMGVVPDSHMFEDSFYNNPSFLSRLGYVFVAGKVNLMKYIGVWLLNETSCILTGIGYREAENPETKEKEVHWDGVTNCRPGLFETTASLKGVIQSFNINTNQWALNYIFKRLRFLGNKDLSQLGALFFLAVWHGFYAGYFLTFGLEFLALQAENSIKDRVALPSGLLRYPVLALAWLARNMVMSYSMITFIGKDWDRCHATSLSIYYCVHVASVLIIVACSFVPKLKPEVKEVGKKQQ